MLSDFVYVIDCPELVKEWDFEKNTLIPSKTKFKSHRSAHWKCNVVPDHKWEAPISSRTQSGCVDRCPYCINKRACSTNDLLTIPKLVSQWHPIKNMELRPKDILFGSHKKVWWLCSKSPEHEWEASPDSRMAHGSLSKCPFCENRTVDNRTSTNARGCPFCSIVPRSIPEIYLMFELSKFFNISYDKHKLIIDNRIYDVDIIIEEHKLIIEYDGAYWHKDTVSRDSRKTRFLTKSGWHVIRIRESPLEKISDHDILQVKKMSLKKVVDQVLTTINKVCKISIDDYLKEENLCNKVAADAYVEKLKKQKFKKSR